MKRTRAITKLLSILPTTVTIFILSIQGLNAQSSQPPANSGAAPEENRFTKVILEEKLNEPMELSVLNDGRVLFIERHGFFKHRFSVNIHRRN